MKHADDIKIYLIIVIKLCMFSHFEFFHRAQIGVLSYGESSILEWNINHVTSNTLANVQTGLLSIPKETAIPVDLASGLNAAGVELQAADWLVLPCVSGQPAVTEAFSNSPPKVLSLANDSQTDDVELLGPACVVFQR